MTYETAKRSEHPGRLLRLVTAGMLFSIAVCYCLQNGSVFGHDKEWIEQCLMDNHLWEQVSRCCCTGHKSIYKIKVYDTKRRDFTGERLFVKK